MRSLLLTGLVAMHLICCACGAATEGPLVPPDRGESFGVDLGGAGPRPTIDAVTAATSINDWRRIGDPGGADQEGALEAGSSSKPDAATLADSGPERVVLGSERGVKAPTDFAHWDHQQVGVACAACHHRGSADATCAGNEACHGSGQPGVPSAAAAFHTACRPCHQQVGMGSGCDLCH